MFISVYQKCKQLACVFAILFTFSSVSWAAPASRNLAVMGSAAISDGDITAAREKAVQQALISAVGRAALELVSPSELVKNLKWIFQNIHDKPDQFIQTYRVLSEHQEPDRYLVAVHAAVDKSAVEAALRDAEILGSNIPPPKILICVSERLWRDKPDRFWWSVPANMDAGISEVALDAVLTRTNYPVVAHDDPIPEAMAMEINNRPDLTTEQAMSMARQFNAQVVVIGNAGASPTQNTMGTKIRTIRGEIALRALAADTGEELMMIRESAITVDTDALTGGRKVLTKIGNLGGNILADKLQAAWEKYLTETPMIHITVSGSKSLASFIKFRRFIGGIDGVNELRMLKMTPNQVSLAVDYEYDAQALSEEILNLVDASFGLHVQSVDAREIKIRLAGSEALSETD